MTAKESRLSIVLDRSELHAGIVSAALPGKPSKVAIKLNSCPGLRMFQLRYVQNIGQDSAKLARVLTQT